MAQADNSYPEFGQGARGMADITGTHSPMPSTKTTGSSSSFLRFCIRTQGITPWAREILPSGWDTHSRASSSRVRTTATRLLISARSWERARSRALLISTIQARNARSPRPTSAGSRILPLMAAPSRSRKCGRTSTTRSSTRRTKLISPVRCALSASSSLNHAPSHLGDVRSAHCKVSP